MIICPLSVEASVNRARQSMLIHLQNSERRFVESTTSRGALTTVEALQVLDEYRPSVLESIDEEMRELRKWLLRGGADEVN
jgi:hypothetical protein